MDPVLSAAKANPFGDRAFYPPGQHPANHREREFLKTLEAMEREWARKEIELGVPLSREDLAKCLEDYRDRVTAFEESESRRKQDYLLRYGS